MGYGLVGGGKQWLGLSGDGLLVAASSFFHEGLFAVYIEGLFSVVEEVAISLVGAVVRLSEDDRLGAIATRQEDLGLGAVVVEDHEGADHGFALLLLYGVEAGADVEDLYALLPELAPRLPSGGDAAMFVAVAACCWGFLRLLGGVGGGVLLPCVVACDQGQQADRGDEYSLHCLVECELTGAKINR